MQSEQDAAGSLTLHLLDAAQGHPVQTWRFAECRCVRIGRADENDITLTDAQVSRKHVELLFQSGEWILFNHGRNGTRVDNELVEQFPLWDSITFQLGTSGPTFQFVEEHQSPTSSQTIEGFDEFGLDFLDIDERRLEEEVEQIAESEAFRQLQQHAERLRRPDNADGPNEPTA